MLCLENTDKLTWIQDDSKHVLSLRHGVGEDGNELADIGLCFALIWVLNNCSVSHKAAANGCSILTQLGNMSTFKKKSLLVPT